MLKLLVSEDGFIVSYFRKNSGTGNSSQTANTPLRMKILVGVIIILFAALIGQLAYLQLFYGSRFSTEVNATDEKTMTKSVPRGVMYDSQGRILVGNKAENAITYMRSLSASSKEMYKVANTLSNYIKITDEKPTKRQIADYYLADESRAKKVLAALPKSQKKSSLSTSEVNDNEVAYVENTIKPSLTSKQKTAAILYNKMSGATTLSTINLKSNGLSNKEIAQVGEHLSSMPGVGIGTDWNRYYPNGSSIKSIIGSVSTTKTGLPSDNLQYYLVNGYSRNDRVGTSYLEKEYEALLKGTKSSYKVTSNSSKEITKTKQVYKGQSGASLKLTIDAKYQAAVTKALKQQFSSALSAGAASLSSGAYAVAMNPNTGAVLAMSGISYDPSTGKITDNALGNINQSFVMGSVVKGAQVAGGLINKVITPTSNTMPDTAIYLPGSPVKKSVYPTGTFGALTAASALEVSSNIYMMQLTLRWVKASYVAKQYIHMPQTAFETLRNNFAMFGLGQKTGIDLPGESSGIQGASTDSNGIILSGSVLDESYGNYDAYTPIQLAQYISTIANGGYRMQPYVVQSIGRTSSDGKHFYAYYNKKPTVQFKIPWTADELAVIKQGLYQVVHGSNAWGTAHALKDVKPSISAKTGTAQTFYYNTKTRKSTDTELINETMVGWASSNNPQIAFAVVFAGIDPDKEGSYNKNMAKAMVTTYYKMHKGKFSSTN